MMLCFTPALGLLRDLVIIAHSALRQGTSELRRRREPPRPSDDNSKLLSHRPICFPFHSKRAQLRPVDGAGGFLAESNALSKTGLGSLLL